MERTRISSGGPFEPIFGYSRAVRVGPFVYVSGTGAIDPSTGKVVGIGDPYAQTTQILQNIAHALTQAGATIEHVVRSRIFVTNITDWEGIAKAHREYFGDIRPAALMVEVSRLVLPEMLVEIECDAVITA
jgi:reactive intermediate/imine deaminase